MKKLAFALALVCGTLVAYAQATWQPGQGVANDHAVGAHPHDVVFVPRGGGAPYGYRAYDTAIGLTFLPWSCPNFESCVKGFRLNLGWGSYAGTYGFDVGTFSNAGDFAGLAINWFGNLVETDAAGLQIGFVNVVGHRTAGLQIGLVNYTEHLDGVQIGLLNFATSQWTLPFINVAW